MNEPRPQCDVQECDGCDKCEAWHEARWQKFYEDNAEMLANLRDKAIEDNKNGLCVDLEADGFLENSEDEAEPTKTKVFLMVECEVEGDPEFFDTSDGTLRVVAREVLLHAMEEYCDSENGEVMKFNCVAGLVKAKLPRIVDNDHELYMVEYGTDTINLTGR